VAQVVECLPSKKKEAAFESGGAILPSAQCENSKHITFSPVLAIVCLSPSHSIGFQGIFSDNAIIFFLVALEFEALIFKLTQSI
jgi:hypothetical protein